MLLLLLMLIVHIGGAEPAYARPEYAVREKISCSACHITPWGGGPRNVFGKAYGTRGEPGSKTVATDLYYGDLRIVGYWPFKAMSQSNSGVAEMEAALAANVPVIQQESGSELRALIDFNLSPLAGTQLREGYARYTPEATSPTPEYWILGHFYVPFGLLTDEHRTYTRIQDNTTLNNFDTGGAYSKDLSPTTHVDVALVNDFQTQGTFSQQKITAGVVGNFRWNPTTAPLLLGASGLWERFSTAPDPWAVAGYGAVSNHTGSILFEAAWAKNWNNPAVNNGGVNPGLPAFFSVNYANSPELLTSSSLGGMFRLNWDIAKMWQIFYKLDILALDASPLSHVYSRHGLGVEWRLNANMYLNTRVEYATYPDDQTSLPPFEGKESDFFAMLRLWF